MDSDGEIMTTKEAVKALFKECGGHKAVAHELDVSLARVYSFTDAACPEHNISFKRAARLTTPQSPALAQYLARKAGGVFCPLPTPRSAAPMALTADAIREHGEAVAAALDALSGKQPTAAAKAKVRKEIEEAICALAALLGHFREDGQ